MNYFLSALVFLLALGQLQRIQLTGNIAFYLHDLLIIGFLGKAFFDWFRQKTKIPQNSKKIPENTKKIFFLFLLSVLLSWGLAIIANRFDYKAILYSLRLCAYIVFVYLLQNQLEHKNWLWRLVSFFILMLGFLQYLLLPDLRFLVYSGYDDHFYRLTSTILDPAFTGLIFVLNLNFYLWQKRLNWAMISLFLVGLLLTYSRASYLAFGLSSLVILWMSQHKSKKAIPALLLIFALCLPFLPKRSGGDGVNLLRTSSAQARIDNDREILESMTGTDWLFGQGLFVPARNRVGSARIPSHAHFADNLLVFLVSNLGIVGSGILATLLYQISKTKILARKENLVFASSLISHAMFNNDLTQSFVVLIFLGFCLSVDGEARA